MNDSEIIKALECCAKSNTSDACIDCPLRSTNICTEEENGVLKLALDFINRQQTEIERLTAIVETAIESTELSADFFGKKAVREFAEKLKKEAHLYLEFDKDCLKGVTSSVKVEDIDRLVEEMTGGTKCISQRLK